MRVLNFLLKVLRAIFPSTSPDIYWHDLDKMPIRNFIAAMNGDISKVIRDPKMSADIEESKKKWEALFNQYISSHGLPENFIVYMENMRKYIDFQNQIIKGSIWLKPQAKLYLLQAEENLKGKEIDIDLECAKLSKIIGFRIKPDECSVNEYFSYVKLTENGR